MITEKELLAMLHDNGFAFTLEGSPFQTDWYYRLIRHSDDIHPQQYIDDVLNMMRFVAILVPDAVLETDSRAYSSPVLALRNSQLVWKPHGEKTDDYYIDIMLLKNELNGGKKHETV